MTRRMVIGVVAVAGFTVTFGLTACRKKTAGPVPAEERPAASASALVEKSASPSAAAESPDAGPRDDERDAQLTLFHELALEEGSVLPMGKLDKVSAEATTAHQKKLAEVYADLAKRRCVVKETIGASHVAATYLHCMIAGKAGEGARLTEQIMNHVPDAHWLYSIEGTEVIETQLATVTLMQSGPPSKGSPTPYALMVTSTGYFHRIEGSLGFVLRRDTGPLEGEYGAREPGRIECLGKKWEEGKISNVSVPSFFVRARDVDGDGREEQPSAIFEHVLEEWSLTAPPKLDGLCNVSTENLLKIAVAGVEGSLRGRKLASETLRPFYEHRLQAARARAQKIREWAELPKLTFDGDAGPPSSPSPAIMPKAVTRIKRYSEDGRLRLTNACALDVAQVAAQLVVYARALGADVDHALVDADALMAGFSVRADQCEGLTFRGDPDSALQKRDQWPALRKALSAKAD